MATFCPVAPLIEPVPWAMPLTPSTVACPTAIPEVAVLATFAAVPRATELADDALLDPPTAVALFAPVSAKLPNATTLLAVVSGTVPTE